MTLTQLELLRQYIAEPDESKYGNAFLQDIIDKYSGDLYAAASEIWSIKASALAVLVDVAEAGASRRMSQARESAAAESVRYAQMAAGSGTKPARYSVTRPIERA